MALGTVTRLTIDPHSITEPVVLGDVKMTMTSVIGDSDYATGGSSVLPADLGLETVLASVCTVAGSAAANGAITASYDATGQLLQMWEGKGTSPNIGLAEADAHADLSGLTVTIVAFGY